MQENDAHLKSRGFNADLEWLVTLKIPFGKYKGWVIADLPDYYLNWFAREGFFAAEKFLRRH